MNSRKLKTFTLIELVVIVAVMAILAGMLLPAWNHARETAESSNCINNLKQLNLAAQTYSVAYDGKFGLFAYYGPGKINYTWFDWLKKAGMANAKDLNKTGSIYRCDTAFTSRNFNHLILYGTMKYTKWGGGKAKPFGITEDSQLTYLPSGWDPSRNGFIDFNKTSGSYPLFFDSSWYYSDLQRCTMFHSVYMDPASKNHAGVWLAHGDKCNMSFVDGSISAKSRDELKSGGFTGGFSAANEFILF